MEVEVAEIITFQKLRCATCVLFALQIKKRQEQLMLSFAVNHEPEKKQA